MAETYTSNIERDGEHRAFNAHGRAAVGSAGGVAVLKAMFEPGWRWSADVAPIAGTSSCQVRHLGYVVSGRMQITMDDGTTYDIGPDDVVDIAPGHDAHVVGDERCVMVDVAPEATRYAKGQTTPTPPSEDRYLALVRRGYAAFNGGDIATLVQLMSHDVIQHVPGSSELAGDYKGIEAVLGYYAKLSEVTDGTARAHLIDVHGDGHGHAVAYHQISATRNGVSRVSRGSILFTFLGDKVTDMLDMSGDLAGDDAFLS